MARGHYVARHRVGLLPTGLVTPPALHTTQTPAGPAATRGRRAKIPRVAFSCSAGSSPCGPQGDKSQTSKNNSGNCNSLHTILSVARAHLLSSRCPSLTFLQALPPLRQVTCQIRIESAEFAADKQNCNPVRPRRLDSISIPGDYRKHDDIF